MTTQQPSAAELAAARTILAGLGIDAARLLDTPTPTRPVPTFAEYIPVVYEAMPDTPTRRHHMSYWTKLLAQWAQRRVDEPSASELSRFVHITKEQRRMRRSDRGGFGTELHCIYALQCLYQHAVDDKLIDAADNPMTTLPTPNLPPSRRQALPHDALAEINHAAATGGDDPALDSLILRLHTETACRRGGALALQPHDLDTGRCLIFLKEKGCTTRWQPISPTLAAALAQHSDTRKPDHKALPQRARNGRPITAHANHRLLRYSNGNPLTTRRYDVLWERLARQLPWIAVHGVTTHWLRHTTLRWVERNFGRAVAKAYADHSHRRSSGDAIDIYTRATIEEVAQALSMLTGEAHPLAYNSTEPWWKDTDPSTRLVELPLTTTQLS
ncbi:tyrosine-type recombinase/integrase [Nocardia noduli]|uniref:tyrosine-type recombinase/integrase n=1 Tax=Nocardia noduli TaxID=2815722 RepID=UPI001C2383F5|nr:site-specific integrase [Nocardia noduli]